MRVWHLIPLILLVGCTQTPIEKTAFLTQEEVSGNVENYFIEDWGFWGVNVTGTVYRDGVWISNVTYSSEKGERATQVIVYDDNISNKYEVIWMNKLLPQPIGVYTIPGKTPCQQGETVTVMVFTEPYCEACRKNEKMLDEFAEKFAGEVSLEYRIVQSESSYIAKQMSGGDVALENELLSKFRLADKYLACSRGDPGFTKLKNCVVNAYQEHLNEPVSDYEIESCIDYAQMQNASSIDECVKQRGDSVLYEDKAMAETYLQPLVIPRAVIDCRIRTNLMTLEHGLCKNYPLLNGCKNSSN